MLPGRRPRPARAVDSRTDPDQMTQLYVVGGRQKASVDPTVKEWRAFEAGVVVRVDLETKRAETVLEYVSPPEAVPDEEPSVVFKSASLRDGRLYVPTQTEVLVYEVPSFRRIGYVSLPSFNDVHHVAPAPDGTLYVANTGLDMVQEIALDGRVVREWSTTDEELWTRFSRDVDYRKVATTKPHKSHPNHTVQLDGDLWVTRCDQHDFLCLTSSRAPIPVADRWIHDGILRGDRLYFTAVNGQVVVMNRDGSDAQRYDLNELADKASSRIDAPLGWCRGLEVLDDGRVVVGFSRMRQTKWKERVKWAKSQLGRDVHELYPTRVATFDLERRRQDDEINLEGAGINAIFSVHRTDTGGVTSGA